MSLRRAAAEVERISAADMRLVWIDLLVERGLSHETADQLHHCWVAGPDDDFAYYYSRHLFGFDLPLDPDPPEPRARRGKRGRRWPRGRKIPKDALPPPDRLLE